MLAHQEDAGEVDAHRVLPVGKREVDDVRHRLARGGAVHQDVERAERFDGGLDRRGCGPGIGDVAMPRFGRSAFRDDVGRDLLRTVRVDIADQHRGAFRSEPPRRRARDAARGCRHHRNFPVEPAHRPVPSLCSDESGGTGKP